MGWLNFDWNDRQGIPFIGSDVVDFAPSDRQGTWFVKKKKTTQGTTPATEPSPQFVAPDVNPAVTGDGGYSAFQAEKERQKTAQLQQLQERRKYLEPLFRSQIATDRGNLESDYNKSKEKLTGQYNEQRTAMKEGFDKSNLESKASYASMGGGSSDSSGMNQWLDTNQGKFTKNSTDLNTAETDQYAEMEKTLTKAKKALEVAENNFFNDLPQFNSLEEIVSYNSQLESQKSTIEKALEDVRTASATYRGNASKNYSGQSLIDMFEGVNKIKNAFGGSLNNNMAQQGLQQWIGNFYSDPNKAGEVFKGIVNGDW